MAEAGGEEMHESGEDISHGGGDLLLRGWREIKEETGMRLARARSFWAQVVPVMRASQHWLFRLATKHLEL